MRYIPILMVLLAPAVLAAQSADSMPGTAAPGGGAPSLQGTKMSMDVKVDVPYHTGIKVTRLWDAFNNCVLQDGTELTEYQYPDPYLRIGATVHNDGSCSYEPSRMHWKVEFLPAGSVNGFAEIGFEQVLNPPYQTYYNFCNVRGASASTLPKIVCLTGRQGMSDTIKISVDRAPTTVKTTLRVNYRGGASSVKVTPQFADSDCFMKDDSATKIDRTSSSSIELKAVLRGENRCGKYDWIGWRVESLAAGAPRTYVTIDLSGTQKPDGYAVHCTQRDPVAGVPMDRREPGDLYCAQVDQRAEQGIEVAAW